MVDVAPRAGAWVETGIAQEHTCNLESHPVRVRGLKLVRSEPYLLRLPGRTPCGCVG